MTIDETNAREPISVGPGADAESQRRAYLELLKLTLCDLAGATTETAYLSVDKSHVYRREPTPQELAFRRVGKDWPHNGLTMVGLTRLDDLQHCVEQVVADGVDGDLIEAGVWRGGASILMRATLDTLGASDREVWLADSFQGFPTPDAESFPIDGDLDLSPHGFLAVTAEQVRGHFARLGLDHDTRFVEGFFHETLPGLQGGSWSLVRLDGDTYESTWTGLESLYPGLAAGGYLVIDDYGFVPACREAVEDYRREHGIDEPIEEVDWNCVRWRRHTAPAPATRTSAQPPDGSTGRGARAADREPSPAIPTAREIELQAEVRRLGERVRRLEASR